MSSSTTETSALVSRNLRSVRDSTYELSATSRRKEENRALESQKSWHAKDDDDLRVNLIGSPEGVAAEHNSYQQNENLNRRRMGQTKSFYAARQCCICIPTAWHTTTMNAAAVTMDGDTMCAALCGSYRFKAESTEITSAHAVGSLRSCQCLPELLGCSVPGEFVVKAGNAGATALMYFSDIDDAAQYVIASTNEARHDVGSTRLRWEKPGACGWKTCFTCRIRHTLWELGPGAVVAVRHKDSHCIGGDCGNRALTISLGRIDGRTGDSGRSGVAAMSRYIPTGACSCANGPTGTCTWAEWLSLELKDGEVVGGTTGPGQSAEVLAAVSAVLRGPNMVPAAVVQQISGTDWCGFEESELTLTTETVELKTYTDGTCTRFMTCGMCSGELSRSIRLEDIEGVTSIDPGICGGSVQHTLCHGLWGGTPGFIMSPVNSFRLLYRIFNLAAATVCSVFCCWACCCRQTIVRITGYGSHELRVRAHADMGASPKDVASDLWDTITRHKGQHAAASVSSNGMAKDSRDPLPSAAPVDTALWFPAPTETLPAAASLSRAAAIRRAAEQRRGLQAGKKTPILFSDSVPEG